MDDLAPAARVGAFGQPAPPVSDGVAEQLLRLAGAGTRPLPIFGAEPAQHECSLLSLAEREVGDHAAVVESERHRSGQTKAQPGPVEAGAVLAEMGLVLGAGVVEGGAALHVKRDAAADDADSPDQFLRHRAGAADRHVILDLTHAVVVQKARDEDVGVRPVELLVPEIVAGRGNPEAPALLVVQDGGEDARRIEVRQTQPVDGAIHPHQRRRAHVADDAVILDGLVTRFHHDILPPLT